MKRYNPKEIEPKWQQVWEDTQIYKARDDSDKNKQYVLDFFPYPSGVAMHMGHVRNYTISDVIARYERMKGNEVLHPMGWDAFGLPAENYAIKNNISPRQAIDENTTRFKEQFKLTGMSYDWSREIDSSKPDYYRWTQWFFSLLFKNGLAYRKKSWVNWCPHDKTVLANEQIIVTDGKRVCERCGEVVEKKELKQWFFKITDYADRLLDDLEDLNWPQAIKSMQRNWIGRSVGAEVDFGIAGLKDKLTIYTTRHDTIYGTTFIVLAPEHPLVQKITTESQKADVEKYVREAESKTEVDRKKDEKDKTGIDTGAKAINPVNGEEIPIWIADYVLMSYGTGVVMGVPAHDDRDHIFAKKYSLPIKQVIDSGEEDDFHREGTIVNSGEYDGMFSADMREKLVKDLEKKGVAKEKVNYKLRDWLISRQRYWGAPIPIVHCKDCGEVAVPDDQLPVELPEMKDYHPSGDGRGPLARDENWVKTTCPKCGKDAERETDTMDGFACSSWYFLRFADPHNDKEAFDQKKAEYWLPVDKYIGGAEHAVMHLLYARFWTKVMFDEGLISFNEPFKELRNQGLLLAEDGRKISKRLENYVPPEKLIEDGYGADSLRTTVMFLAPFDQETPWSNDGLSGIFRFLQRAWTLAQEYLTAEVMQETVEAQNVLETRLVSSVNKTTRKVTRDLEQMGYNTAIAALMELVNEMYKIKVELPFSNEVSRQAWHDTFETLLRLLAPFAPHITEELWEEFGNGTSIHASEWPAWDESLITEELVTLIVQINGKVRANLSVEPDLSEEDLVKEAKTDEKVQKYLENKELVKTITVPNKLVNFVVK